MAAPPRNLAALASPTHAPVTATLAALVAAAALAVAAATAGRYAYAMRPSSVSPTFFSRPRWIGLF